MMKDKTIVLNIGAGKCDLERFGEYDFVVHLDRFFSDNSISIAEAEEYYQKFHNDELDPVQTAYHFFCKSDIFEFLDTFRYKFNLVIAERIFEHQEYLSGEIGRMLEAINTITSKDAVLKIVVPNMILVSEMLLDYEKNAEKFTIPEQINKKLIINSEFTNIKVDPHASVWTPRLAKEYIESEGTWKIKCMHEQWKHEGRDIYMQMECEKPNKEG